MLARQLVDEVRTLYIKKYRASLYGQSTIQCKCGIVGRLQALIVLSLYLYSYVK